MYIYLVYMYICMYVCIYIYIYTYTHTHTHNFNIFKRGIKMRIHLNGQHMACISWIYIHIPGSTYTYGKSTYTYGDLHTHTRIYIHSLTRLTTVCTASLPKHTDCESTRITRHGQETRCFHFFSRKIFVASKFTL